MQQRLFILSQYLLPHHLLSRLAGCIAECRVRWFKNAFTAWFAKRYQVDMSQALVEDLTAYEHFNAFFTRALKDGARPLDQTPGAVLSPADGAVSQLGPIEHGRVFQAKGHSFSVLELLGGDAANAAPFMGGDFATIYLSPKDYHRVHMPLAGTLREMVYIPGRIFSVNQTTAENVPELFARNERVACIFDTERGPMAVVLVGGGAPVPVVLCAELCSVVVSVLPSGNILSVSCSKSLRFFSSDSQKRFFDLFSIWMREVLPPPSAALPVDDSALVEIWVLVDTVPETWRLRFT